MAKIRLTKNELRSQEAKKRQLERYLPTLQLKKAMLQVYVNEAKEEMARLETDFKRQKEASDEYAPLLTEPMTVGVQDLVVVEDVLKHHENIAGVDVPFFDDIRFKQVSYNLFETPPWLDAVVSGLSSLMRTVAEKEIVAQKKRLLEHELRQVFIRVNLFEKILIPRAEQWIKKIRVLLGDQQLAAVGQAKVAKTKIEERKLARKRLYGS